MRATGTAGAWWSTPLDRTAQWTVTREDVPWSPPIRQPVADELTRWHAQTVAEETTAGRDRPRDPRASWSGTWWSMPPAELTRSTRPLGDLGPVGLRLVEDFFGWGLATTRPLATPGGATVYEVDGPDAWAVPPYPLEVTAARRHDWYRATGVDTRCCVPDWSRAAADLDAVHLTVAGYLRTPGAPSSSATA